MSKFLVTALLVVVAPGALGSSLRASPVKAVNSAVNALEGATESLRVEDTTETQVEQLREKLTKMSGGFSKVLSGGKISGSSQVGAMMSKFNAQLKQTLDATKSPKDMKKALKQLQDANTGVQQLSKDITNEQVQLMHEGDEQEQSLLLGVLMQKQKEPMSKQLEVANSPDFAKLPVVVAVLAAKDMKTPLFQQVAAYLDAHSSEGKAKKAEAAIPQKLAKGKDGKPDVTPIVLALEARLHKMEESEDRMEDHHTHEMTELDRVAGEKKSNKRAVHQIKRMKKEDDRDFKKQSAMAKNDIQALKSAITSVKNGDMAGLAKAQSALDTSMKAAQAHAGKFLYLIQLAARTEGQDCPFCVAQCVDKCHNTDAKPYTTCLTVCADAGK